MKRLFFAVMLCVCALTMWAVPAKRITIEVKQPDGTVLTLTQRGDEHFHYLMTEDGVVVKTNGKGYYYADIADGKIVASKRLAHARESRSQEEMQFVKALPSVNELYGVAMQRESTAQRVRAARAPQRAGEVQTTGDVHVPVLLVQYSDVKFVSSDPKAAFEGHINGDDYKDEGGYGSVKEYFEDQSEGKFMPKFEIIGPVTLSNNMEYYGGNDEEGNDKNARKMVEDACRQANSMTDFAKFDNNGDGYVDIVYVIYAGYGEASNAAELENTIWPHQWQLANELSLDGVKISKYACNNELDGWDESNHKTLDGIGTFCHEFSHCLGLPDFYPTDDSNGFGMNSWSLMDYGCYNNNGHTPCGYTGYEKDFLGWKDLVVLDAPTDVTLTPMSEGGTAYKIINDANADEYYIVENHKKSKWDTFAPAEGMLVIHVDYQEMAWKANAVNNEMSHQRMTIIPADNKLDKNSLSGDTYPGTSGNTELTATSKPAAKVYADEYMGKDITDISMNNGVVTFSFMKGALPVPTLNEATDITENAFSITWDEIPGIKEYEVQLELLEENPYMLDEDFDKVKQGNSDIGMSLDSYTNQKGWMGQNVFGLDKAIRMGSSSARGALMTPKIGCDSTHFTVIFSVRKSAASDKDAYMIMAVGDDAWGDGLFGYGIPVDDHEWLHYFVVMDTIGTSSFLYMDTRDNDKTPTTESTRVDLDYIYVLPGDRSKELLGEDEEEKESSEAPKRTQYRQLYPTSMPQDCGKRMAQAKQTAPKAAADEQSTTEKRYYSTVIYAERTEEDSCRFENLDGGLYRVSVRSARDSVYSRYSNTVEVEIVDTMLQQLEVEIEEKIDNDSVYFVTNDSTIAIFYTLDGTTPTAYSHRYDGPFATTEKATIYYILRKEGYRRSPYYRLDNWFEADGATYRIESTVTPRAKVSGGFDGNDADSYVGHITIGDEVTYDSVAYAISGIDDRAFSNATQLRSVTVSGAALKNVGEELFYGCTSLNAVVWDIDLPITADMFDETSYHNLLVYVNDDIEFAHPLISAKRMALIENGQTDSLELEASYPFYAPRSFTAKCVNYQRSFTQTTGLESSAGWETITLPFDVQQFVHSTKGDIAPFGNAANHHFWLAQYEGGAFAAATELKANVPYIIAMPNNSEYGANSLSGMVSFAAANATIQATGNLVGTVGKDFTFVPNYDALAADAGIYALNVGSKFDAYNAGSVFVPEKFKVNPFSAYIVPSANAQGAPMFRIQMQGEPEEIVYEYTVTSKNGIVYVTLPEERTITVYDMMGRKVCAIDGQKGINEITHLSEGVYMIEKTKVYVKR